MLFCRIWNFLLLCGFSSTQVCRIFCAVWMVKSFLKTIIYQTQPLIGTFPSKHCFTVEDSPRLHLSVTFLFSNNSCVIFNLCFYSAILRRRPLFECANHSATYCLGICATTFPLRFCISSHTRIFGNKTV